MSGKLLEQEIAVPIVCPFSHWAAPCIRILLLFLSLTLKTLVCSVVGVLEFQSKIKSSGTGS